MEAYVLCVFEEVCGVTACCRAREGQLMPRRERQP